MMITHITWVHHPFTRFTCAHFSLFSSKRNADISPKEE